MRVSTSVSSSRSESILRPHVRFLVFPPRVSSNRNHSSQHKTGSFAPRFSTYNVAGSFTGPTLLAIQRAACTLPGVCQGLEASSLPPQRSFSSTARALKTLASVPFREQLARLLYAFSRSRALGPFSVQIALVDAHENMEEPGGLWSTFLRKVVKNQDKNRPSQAGEGGPNA